MKGRVGDRLVLKGTHVGDHTRVGVITELRREDGTPPYVVRWLDTGHEALVFPGTDAHVETLRSDRADDSSMIPGMDDWR